MVFNNLKRNEKLKKLNIFYSLIYCFGYCLILKPFCYKQLNSSRLHIYLVNIINVLITLGTYVLVRFIKNGKKADFLYFRIYIMLLFLINQAYVNAMSSFLMYLCKFDHDLRLKNILFMPNIYFILSYVFVLFLNINCDLQLLFSNILGNIFVISNIFKNEKIENEKNWFFISTSFTIFQSIWFFITFSLLVLMF
ncbi:hypothetical protein EHP00_933 [Ecytonucleospora hepatopenaei]|uniref:Uncharacterized protein n=1 Tax=Ecytonucleospora hepatopenaei TaxID=646526 RepID=A0A1W0E6Z1_9MICR|nr:hypothetical protein EHP00_933 [Ecytonucleospora hepatopenaei]